MKTTKMKGAAFVWKIESALARIEFESYAFVQMNTRPLHECTVDTLN